MGKLRTSLRLRLVCVMLAVTLPIAGAATLWLGYQASRQLRDTAVSGVQGEGMDLAMHVQTWDASLVTILDTLSRNPDIISMDPQRQQPILRTTAQVTDQIGHLKTSRLDGSTLAHSSDLTDYNFSDRQWFRGVMAGRRIVRQSVISRVDGEAVVIFAAPIRDASGLVVGAISATSNLRNLDHYIATNGLGQTGYRFVVDEQGRVLSHRDTDLASTLADMSGFAPVQALQEGGIPGNVEFTDDQDVRWIAHVTRLDNGWGVISLQQEAEVLGAFNGYRSMALLAMILSGLLVSVLTWIAATRFVTPILELTAAAMDVAAGQRDRRVTEDRVDEIGQLSRSFNQMVAELDVGVKSIEERIARRTRQLVRSNAELQRARQAAEEANKLKDEFLANMSHEVRTPLTAIVGYAELLTDVPMSEEEKLKALQSIQSNGQHLLNVINDVLDVAKLEANKMEVEVLEVEPARLVNEVLTLMRSRAQEKNLRLSVQYESRVPALIQTDPTRLRQILMNLVGNAIKYTHNGCVQVLVRMNQFEDRPDAELQFDIVDTGIGITPEAMGKLFQPFSQGCVSRSREYGGTGLGLAISKRLARLLGGDITVQSTFGEGSTFTVRIKIGAAAKLRLVDPQSVLHDSVAAIPFMEDEHKAELESVRVLVADDRPHNQDLITKMLGSAGAQVTTTSNGKVACHMAMEAFQAGKPFHIILMDMQMPEMDGLEAARRLRKLGYPGPIIALTASVQESDKPKCFESGCNDFVRKPFERDKLIGAVLKWVRITDDASQSVAGVVFPAA